MSTATEIRYLRNNLWQRRGYTSTDPGPSTPVGNISATALQALLTAGSTNQIFQLASNTVYTGFESINQGTGLVLKSGQKLVGAADGTTTFDGRITVTGWTAGSGYWYKDGILPAPYLGTWNGTTFSGDGGQSEIPFGNTARPDIAGQCYPREQLWRDEVHLFRVMRLQDVGPGKFFQDFTLNRTYVGDDPTGHVMKMSKARYALQAADASYPNVLSGCALANISFRGFASKSQLGAVTIAGNGWEISNCLFTGNHAIGLHLADADNAWIHHNRFHANGQLGMGHNRSDNTVVEDNEFYLNNTDGYWIADWESGGCKVTYSQNNIFRRNKVWDNAGVGVWHDIDNRDAQIYGNDIWDNVADGDRFEISYGAKIHDNWITGNGLQFRFGLRVPESPYSMLAVAGINVNSSPNVEIYNNMMSPDPTRLVTTSLFGPTAVHTRGNQNGVSLQMRNRGNGGYGPRDLNNCYVHHNDITLTSYFLADRNWTTGVEPTGGETVSGLRTLQVDVALYNSATKNNRFDYNTYRVDSTTARRFSQGNGYKPFAQMKADSAAAGNPWEVNGTILGAPRDGLRVTTGGDDGTWTSVGTTAYSASTAANLIGDFAADSYGHCAWVRIPSVNIPQGATIDSAYLEVLARGANIAAGGTPPKMLVRAHNFGNSAQPTGRANISDRPRTSQQVAWEPATWPVGTWMKTPSLVAVVQELVNRVDWAAGNAITFMIEPQTLGFSTQQFISFTGWDDPSRSAPGLIVTYH